jgi:hypothetical protein
MRMTDKEKRKVRPSVSRAILSKMGVSEVMKTACRLIPIKPKRWEITGVRRRMNIS